MKNIFRKTYKSILALGLIVFFGLNMFVPVFSVKADSRTIELNISFRNESNHLYSSDQGHVKYSLDSGESWLEVNKSDGFHNSVQVPEGKDLKIKIVSNGGYFIDWTGTAYRENNGERIELKNDSFKSVRDALQSGDGYTVSSTATSFELESVEFYEEGNGPGPGPGEMPTFNHEAYFIWKCDGNKVCVFDAKELDGFDDGTNSVSNENPYVINYFKEENIVDESKGIGLEISDLNDGDYFWILTHDDFLDRLNKNIDEHTNQHRFTSEQINDMESRYNALGEAGDNLTWNQVQEFVSYLENIDGDAKRAFALDPTGAKNGANSICTNGDRLFRATIYDDDNYEALKFDVDENNYTYFLADWDPAFISPEIDISGTSKENPAFYEIYLLEPNLKFELSKKTKTGIKSIKALDVNKNAVSITNKNGVYTINFNSNYYNQVLFEITTNNNKKYYVVVNRIVGDLYENVFDDSADRLIVGANLLFPDTDTYQDYEVIANITRKNGIVESISASNIKRYHEDVNHGRGVYTEKPVEEIGRGKGLKVATYGIEVDDDIVTVSFSAIRNGALNNKKFGGAFAGSGQGFEFDWLDRAKEDFSHNHGGVE